MTDKMESINVIYKFIDGAHFFVSDDKKAVGLCVANTSLDVAYSEVGSQLTALMKFNHGVDIAYYPGMPLEKFKKLIEAYKAVTEAVDDSDIVNPATIQPWLHSYGMKAKEAA